MKKIILLLCLVSTQIFAQQSKPEPVPFWIQLENERRGSLPKAEPKSSFNPDVFRKTADREMKRVNQEFAWIAKRERDRKAKSKKPQTNSR